MLLEDRGSGGHSLQSQHYAGVAFDVAQGWTNAQRAVLRNLARNSGVWSYVEPLSISPTWVGEFLDIKIRVQILRRW